MPRTKVSNASHMSVGVSPPLSVCPFVCQCACESVCVCVGGSEGSPCLDRLLACEFELWKVMRISADHRHSPAALLFLFYSNSSRTSSSKGRRRRRQLQRRQLLPNRFVSPPFFAVGDWMRILVPHRCRAWTAVANDWGLILWCFCAYASTLTPTPTPILARLAQFIEKVTLQSAKERATGERGAMWQHILPKFCPANLRVSPAIFSLFCVCVDIIDVKHM